MQQIDYIILICYLAGVFLVGILLSMKNKSSEDMFAASGESPWWTSGLSAFMTMFSAGTFVVWGGIAYKHGLVAVTINICYGIAAIAVGYLIAGKWKKLGVRTPAQFIELRFGTGAVQFYTWSMMIFRIVGVAVALYALSNILVALMPLAEGNPLRDPATGNLSLTWAVIIFGGIVVIYTMVGGLWAVLMTDVLQFIVLNLAVLFVVPLAFKKAGGVSAFIDKAPEQFFSVVAQDKYTWFFMFGWVLIHFFMIGAEWAFAQRFLCVPSAKDARKSTYLFGILYLVSPLLWLLPPMIYRVIDPNANPERAYILACKSVLPVGMVGLMVAAMFSATASMVSSQLNVFAGVLTDEFYRRLLKPNSSEKHLVNVGRFFTILLGVILIGISLAIPYLGGAEKVIISLTSLLVGPLLAPTIWGLLGGRITQKAVWVTAGICFIVGIPVKFGFSADGWFSNIEVLSGLCQWVQNNGKTVDLIIGVILPVVILAFMHHSAKTVAAGWQRVESLEKEIEQENKIVKVSSLPAIIVAFSLIACSIMMFSLLAFNANEAGLLSTFGTILLLIAVSIFLTVYLKKKDTRIYSFLESEK